MSIDQLIEVMPAPSSPFETPPAGGWSQVEGRLGVSFPQDYRDFIDRYGSGKVADFLWIFNPFSANENLNLERQIQRQAAVLDELKGYGEKNPYEPFPSPGGILPVGITGNGDVIFWKTEQDGGHWSVVVNDSRSPEWELFNFSLSQFLIEVLAKRAVCRIFPRDFPVGRIAFESSTA
jgi:hypothetical protein